MKNKMEVVGNMYCAGVYGMKVRNQPEYLYIGSALEINDACSRHLYYLKRGLYSGTNKEILQKYYDMGELVFEVIKESCHDKVSEMSIEEKESLSKALGVLEKMYLELYKVTACNAHQKITRHSSNKNKQSTYKRRRVNLGSNNPNQKYEEEHVCNILYLKEHGFKNQDIAEIVKKECGIDVTPTYVSAIGNTKWIHINGKYEDWMNAYLGEVVNE